MNTVPAVSSTQRMSWNHPKYHLVNTGKTFLGRINVPLSWVQSSGLLNKLCKRSDSMYTLPRLPANSWCYMIFILGFCPQPALPKPSPRKPTSNLGKYWKSHRGDVHPNSFVVLFQVWAPMYPGRHGQTFDCRNHFLIRQMHKGLWGNILLCQLLVGPPYFLSLLFSLVIHSAT